MTTTSFRNVSSIMGPRYRWGKAVVEVMTITRDWVGAGIAQLVVLGLAATVSRVRYSSGDIFR